MRKQRVDEPAAEIQSGFVRRARTVGNHSRPRDGELVVFQPELRHERHVLAETVIAIAGDCGRIAVASRARPQRKDIPGRPLSAAFAGSAFDLRGRGRDAPNEIRWKCAISHKRFSGAAVAAFSSCRPASDT